jgi:hypothetical protein
VPRHQHARHAHAVVGGGERHHRLRAAGRAHPDGGAPRRDGRRDDRDIVQVARDLDHNGGAVSVAGQPLLVVPEERQAGADDAERGAPLDRGSGRFVGLGHQRVELLERVRREQVEERDVRALRGAADRLHLVRQHGLGGGHERAEGLLQPGAVEATALEVPAVEGERAVDLVGERRADLPAPVPRLALRDDDLHGGRA